MGRATGGVKPVGSDNATARVGWARWTSVEA
jgi:hypothetical protein